MAFNFQLVNTLSNCDSMSDSLVETKQLLSE